MTEPATKRHVHSTEVHNLSDEEKKSGGLIVQYRAGVLNFTCPCGLPWTWGNAPYKGVAPVVPQKEFIKPNMYRGVCTCGNVLWKSYWRFTRGQKQI